MPLPMRMGALDQFIDPDPQPHPPLRLRPWCSSTPSWWRSSSPSEGDPPFLSLDDLVRGDGPGSDAYDRPTSDPDSLAVLQFTSGSTSEPKGVMLPHRAICQNLDWAWEAAQLSSHEKHRVLAAALPRHGSDRSADHPDDHGRGPGAGRPAGLPGPAAALDAVDVGLRGHGHRRAELRLRAGRPGPAAVRGAPGAVPGAHLAQRRRAGRRRDLPQVLRRRRAVRAGPVRGVPRLRHGRGVHRRLLPTPGQGPPHRLGRQAGPRARAPGGSRPTPRPRAPSSWSVLGSPSAGHGDAHRRPVHRRGAAATGRSGSCSSRGNSADRRLLQAARRHRGAHRRRLAAHRRPVLLRGRASSWSAAGPRT